MAFTPVFPIILENYYLSTEKLKKGRTFLSTERSVLFLFFFLAYNKLSDLLRYKKVSIITFINISALKNWGTQC